MAAELVSDRLFVQWLCVTLWAGPSVVAFKAQRGRQRQQHALRVCPLALKQSPVLCVQYRTLGRYDDNDFYDVLSAISNPNHSSSTTGCVSWGVIKVILCVMSRCFV